MKDIYLSKDELDQRIHSFLTRKREQFEEESREKKKVYLINRKTVSQSY